MTYVLYTACAGLVVAGVWTLGLAVVSIGNALAYRRDVARRVRDL